MLQFIMEQNVLLYVLGAACLAGVVSQILLRQIYESLIKDTRNTGEPEGRFLQQLRQRFQYCLHLNERVGDVQALIRKGLMEYRFWGLSLHAWSRISAGGLAVSLLCAFAGTMARIQTGAEAIQGNPYFWMGLGALILTALAFGIADIGYREKALEIRLCDYLENSGIMRNYSEAAMQEDDREREPVFAERETGSSIVSVSESRRAAKRQAKAEAAAARAKADSGILQSRAQREKNDLKENLARMKAGAQEAAAEGSGVRPAEILRQMDPKEQERILREVLKEFLA